MRYAVLTPSRVLILSACALALAAAWLWLAAVPAQRVRINDQAARIATLQALSAVAPATIARQDGAVARAAAPLDLLAADVQLTATAAGLTLLSTTFQPAPRVAAAGAPSAPKTDITAEFKGGYGAFKTAAADLLERHPNVALVRIALRRAKSTETAMDITAAFTAFDQ